MSHFPVLVVMSDNDAEALKAALQPFHEYECTGINDEYVVDIDKTDEVMEHWAKVAEKEEAEGETLESWARDYYGYDQTPEGRFIRHTNPNKKWDWWVVGGRWKGKFIVNGEHVDFARKSDLDMKAMRKVAQDYRRKNVQAAYKKISDKHRLSDEKITRMWDKFRQIVASLTAEWEQLERPKRLWDWMPEQSDDFVALYALGINDIGKWGFDGADVPETEANPFEWCESAPPLSCFAFLGEDGVWKEKGEMGWFACVSNEKDNWETEFAAQFDAVDSDKWLVIVDCHI